MRRVNRYPRIETYSRVPKNERITVEAIVFRSVLNHQGNVTGNSVRAKRDCTIGFLDVKANACLEPLAIFINEGEQSNWYPATPGRLQYNRIETRLRQRIQNLILM